MSSTINSNIGEHPGILVLSGRSSIDGKRREILFLELGCERRVECVDLRIVSIIVYKWGVHEPLLQLHQS